MKTRKERETYNNENCPGCRGEPELSRECGWRHLAPAPISKKEQLDIIEDKLDYLIKKLNNQV